MGPPLLRSSSPQMSTFTQSARCRSHPVYPFYRVPIHQNWAPRPKFPLLESPSWCRAHMLRARLTSPAAALGLACTLCVVLLLHRSPASNHASDDARGVGGGPVPFVIAGVEKVRGVAPAGLSHARRLRPCLELYPCAEPLLLPCVSASLAEYVLRCGWALPGMCGCGGGVPGGNHVIV